MLSASVRRQLNDGKEISFVPGFRRLREEVLDPLQADTFVIFDTHWFTTVEVVVASHDRRSGKFTSDELPRGMSQVPFDYAGDPELARLAAGLASELGVRTTPIDDPYLPVHYATINLVHYLHRGEKVVSVSTVQTGETPDFLTLGEGIGEAVRRLDRRVVLMASGGLSHRFWPLQELEKHEASDPVHIITTEAREADQVRLAWMEAGNHRAVIDSMGEYRLHSPEGRFGHYLGMVGAIGGVDCTARGRRYSDYENATGTGQVHMWFDRPAGGWTSGA
jgi:aromatic ring-opening dioxygenase catalytic subunit (LigB family)